MSIYITPQMIHPGSDGRGSHQDSGLFQRLVTSVIRTWRRRKAIAELRAMDDAVLRDIGINRNDILRVVNGFDDRDLGMVPLARTARSKGTRAQEPSKGDLSVVPA